MIIKIEAVPKLVVEDGVEKVVMGENNQPVWDKGYLSQPRAAITAESSRSQMNWRQRWQKETDTSMP